MVSAPDNADAELRHSLHKLNASEAQFESVLKLHKNWLGQRAELERQMQGAPDSTGALAEQLRALDAARDQEYQRVLGAAAFEAMQREQDYRYATMKRYANTWNLDEGRMDYVYRTIRYYEKVVQDYEREAQAMAVRGEAVDWDRFDQNLRQFSQQTQQTMQSYLGAEVFNKLQKNHVFPFGHGG